MTKSTLKPFFKHSAIALAVTFCTNTIAADEGRILVQPKAGLPEHALEKILQQHGGQQIGKISNIDVRIINVPSHAKVHIIEALKNNPHISFAEEDRKVKPHLSSDDPRFSSQWHLPKVSIESAWDFAKGDSINIAVLDTGVDPDHPDLVNKLLPGWNSASSNTDWFDINGHGTKVSGTAAAMTNNGTGVAGAAWNASIIPVRVTDSSDGYAYFSAIANGLTWAADNGAHVANISYGVSGSSAVTSAASYMRSKGGVVVVSAGNSGSEFAIADNAHMISVSATDSNDVVTSWSTFGSFVDVAAPGSGIVTTANGGGYTSASGTSFSSPLTAGVVALIMSANRQLSAAEVENILMQSAVDKGTGGRDKYYGHGRIDASAAVQMAINTNGGGDVIAPQVAILSPIAKEISGLINIDVDASDNVAISEVSLMINGVQVGSDTSAPYAFSWDSSSVADGNVEIKVIARDSSGNIGSDVINSLVNNIPDIVDVIAPELTIHNPLQGDAVGSKILIQASATDNVGIALLSCYVDGALKGSTNANSLECIVNSRKMSPGEHEVSVVARDAAGNQTQKAVTVMLTDTVKSGGTDGGAKGKGRK